MSSSSSFSVGGCSCGAWAGSWAFSSPGSASSGACGSGLGLKGTSVCGGAGAVVCVQLMGARAMAGWRGQKSTRVNWPLRV